MEKTRIFVVTIRTQSGRMENIRIMKSGTDRMGDHIQESSIEEIEKKLRENSDKLFCNDLDKAKQVEVNLEEDKNRILICTSPIIE